MTAAGSPSPLRRSAAQGAKWTGAAAVVTVATQVLQVIVLARLLTPSEFGLAALAISILGFGTVLTDAGISNAIIARQTTSHQELSSLYWANVIAGFGAFVLSAALAPVIALAFGEKQLTTLLLIGACMFLLAPIGQQFRVLLQRDLRFRVLGAIDAISAITAAAAAIAAAGAGLGATSLVAGLLVLNGVKSVLCAAYGWRATPPALRLRWREVRGYVGFGLYVLGQRLTSHAAYNVDYLIIGSALGPAALGAYTIAFQLVVRPQVQLNPIFATVVFPVFARRQTDDAALARGYTEVSRIVAMLAFPALAGLAVVAPDLVPAVIGEQWTDAVSLIQILSLLGALRALTIHIGPVLLARDEPQVVLWLTAGSLILVAIAVFIGVQFGIVVASWMHVLAVSILFIAQLWVLYRVIGLRPMAYLGPLIRPALISAVMAIVVLGVAQILHSVGASTGVSLLVEVASGTVTYLYLLIRTDRPYLAEMIGLLRTRARGQA